MFEKWFQENGIDDDDDADADATHVADRATFNKPVYPLPN